MPGCVRASGAVFQGTGGGNTEQSTGERSKVLQLLVPREWEDE